MAVVKVKKEKEDLCEQIKEWQKNPDFIRAVREFIRLTTS